MSTIERESPPLFAKGEIFSLSGACTPFSRVESRRKSSPAPRKFFPKNLKYFLYKFAFYA